MRRWEAAVATENPRILYQAVQLLKRLDIDFIICYPTDNRCNQSQVIITDVPDYFQHHEGLVLVQENFDMDFVRITIMARLRMIQTPSKAVIGIDPGMTSGVALVVDGIVLYQISLAIPSAVVELSCRLIGYIHTLFPSCQSIIKVGTGSKLYSTLLLRAIFHKTQELEIELVNEKNTTLSGGAGSDESSAIIIAGRSGRKVISSDMLLEVKVGYIRSLKQFVIRLTRGKRALTSNEARAILLDELTFDEIVVQPMS
ncbi:MAG: hypothetical protein ACFFCT_07285 [Candidatus Odinarchaeota archaeon]|nr:hypothetical protein [Candidatus Thorarchaeota archaeon]